MGVALGWLWVPNRLPIGCLSVAYQLPISCLSVAYGVALGGFGRLYQPADRTAFSRT
jgi:hypothetical protein